MIVFTRLPHPHIESWAADGLSNGAGRRDVMPYAAWWSDGSARWVRRGTGRIVIRCVEAGCAPVLPGALNRVCPASFAFMLSRGFWLCLVNVSLYVLPALKGIFRSVSSRPCVAPSPRLSGRMAHTGRGFGRGVSGEACGWHLEAADGWFVPYRRRTPPIVDRSTSRLYIIRHYPLCHG